VKLNAAWIIDTLHIHALSTGIEFFIWKYTSTDMKK